MRGKVVHRFWHAAAEVYVDPGEACPELDAETFERLERAGCLERHAPAPARASTPPQDPPPAAGPPDGPGPTAAPPTAPQGAPTAPRATRPPRHPARGGKGHRRTPGTAPQE